MSYTYDKNSKSYSVKKQYDTKSECKYSQIRSGMGLKRICIKFIFCFGSGMH